MPNKKLPSVELLEDLCTRFILNVPAEELESFERMLFLVEEAHWFYEDFCRDSDPSLKTLSLKEFTALIFKSCPGLQPYAHLLDSIYSRFLSYKLTVPVMGAILVDPSMEKCLLVRGYKDAASWGFPRGKIAKDETDVQCAVREVMEETGFDITGRVREDDAIEVHVQQQRSKLFIVPDIDESTEFATKTRKEIGGFAWHRISEMPSSKEQAALVYQNESGVRHRFWNVWPYMKPLQRYIARRRRAQGPSDGKARGKAPAASKKRAPGSAAGTPVPQRMAGAAAQPSQRGAPTGSGSNICAPDDAGVAADRAFREHIAQLPGARDVTKLANSQKQLFDELAADDDNNSASEQAAAGHVRGAANGHTSGGALQAARQAFGQSWQGFKLDQAAVMRQLDAALSRQP